MVPQILRKNTFLFYALYVSGTIVGANEDGLDRKLTSGAQRDVPSIENATSASNSGGGMETFVLTISCLCVLITVIGLLGNLLVICVLTGSSTRMVYETFCVGLAWTDLTYLSLSCPITVVQYYIRSWIFGLFWCKVFFFIVQVTVFSTAFMLLGLTTSRFLSVVLPWQNLKMTELQAKLSCLAAWFVGIIFALPVMIFQVLVPIIDVGVNPQPDSQTNSSHKFIQMEVFCRTEFPDQTSRLSYQMFVLLSTYVIPFIGIIIMNSMIVYKLQHKTAIDRHQENQYATAYKTQQRHQSLRQNALDRLRALRFGSGSHPGRHTETSDIDYTPDESNKVPISSVHKTQKDSLSLPNEPRNSVLSPADLIRIEKIERKRRMRTKATKLVVMVTTLWCVCWLPTHVINSWFFFDEKTFPFTATMKKIKLITQTLSFVASCVNPVVYGIMTGTFKNAITNRLFRRTRQPTTTAPVINGAGVTELPSILVTQASARDFS
ncbi:hypothetical protein PHET_01061 [Paragonimus heterotremus]|uniref:G-protein coupled receptors family 1 profile domain-containing protein n=1 Tax=Paragonimus heterotremus TaxID=100268 RepID=A0A8J4TNS4_9TREM|nr:hypothetical protein PHET_01061 [Paragonimus heterotremus]